MIRKETSFRITKFKGKAISIAVCAMFGAVSGGAVAADMTLTGAVTWGTAATGMVDTPTAGDAVNQDTFKLTFNGTQTPVVAAGALSGVAGGLDILGGGSTALSTQTIGSINYSGAGAIKVTTVDAAAFDVITTVTGAVTTGGKLEVLNLSATQANSSSLTIGGAATITGVTNVTGGAFAGASTSTLTVTGNAAFTGLVTVTGGANAAAVATMKLTHQSPT